jgi:LPS export ABC transporter protein LptC
MLFCAPVIDFSRIVLTEGWHKCRPSFFSPIATAAIVIGSLLLFACDKTESVNTEIYEGPIREAENIEMLYSEAEKVTVKIKAKRISEFQTGDRHFPEGVFIEFFGEDGSITSTLSANTAYYYKAENKWKGQGKVEVKNLEKQEQLNTEELFWYPTTKKINTDKFVTVRTANEVLYGTGLDAKQDMSEYEILKPNNSVFVIEE